MIARPSTNIYFEASAPGRLDVMGGIADYSGSLVLQMPVREETSVKLALRNDYRCMVESKTNEGERMTVSMDYRDLLSKGRVNYEFAQHLFKKDLSQAWVAYVIGCALVLQSERGIAFKGADILIQSDVPLGKGVSSSASLEVATMKAMGKAFELSFAGTELPALAQKVENLVVGAPCGLMDQLTSYFGERRKLLPIICQPDKIGKPISVPSGISFMGIDSGVRHSVSGSSYADVRCAAFMGYSIIVRSLGVSNDEIRECIRTNDFTNLPFGGYLSNISADEFANKYVNLLPGTISGKEFLSQYGQTIDRLSTVNDFVVYRVKDCTSHPVQENNRVHLFKAYLESLHNAGSTQAKEMINNLGMLMGQSHESYSRCGLGSARTDGVVAHAREKIKEGIAGEKITGGGSGGTVCMLAVGPDGVEAVKQLHVMLEKKYKTKLALFET